MEEETLHHAHCSPQSCSLYTCYPQHPSPHTHTHTHTHTDTHIHTHIHTHADTHTDSYTHTNNTDTNNTHTNNTDTHTHTHIPSTVTSRVDMEMIQGALGPRRRSRVLTVNTTQLYRHSRGTPGAGGTQHGT